MEKYNIIIYSLAKKDLIDIIEYINTLSPLAAIKLYDNIIENIGALSYMPQRCALAKDNNLRLKGYRILVVENYLVFFVIKGNIVGIRRIIYGKRNYLWLIE